MRFSIENQNSIRQRLSAKPRRVRQGTSSTRARDAIEQNFSCASRDLRTARKPHKKRLLAISRVAMQLSSPMSRAARDRTARSPVAAAERAAKFLLLIRAKREFSGARGGQFG